MWATVATWLAKQGLLKMIAESILKQGFSVLLLIAAVFFLYGELTITRNEMLRRDEILRQEIEECNKTILLYYREDQKKTNVVIERATAIMERLEKQLK